MKKIFSEFQVSQFTKKKNILYAVVNFEGLPASSLYIYDLVTHKILRSFNFEGIKMLVDSCITYNLTNEQLLISDALNDCIHIVFTSKSK